MSEAKHTPGPWKVVKPGHGHRTKYRCVQIGKDERYTTLEVLPADARLMAAAPDLLEVAKSALRTLILAQESAAEGGAGGGDDDEMCEEAKFMQPAIDELRKVIARAPGK